MKVRVRSVFGVATLQDEGRFGFRKSGVPVGGAFDREAFRLANALLGNALDAPTVEFALGTMEMEAMDDGVMAFVGAANSVLLNGVEQGGDVRLPVRTGDLVTVTPPKRGLRTYVALPGGIAAPRALGSVSGAVVDRDDVLESAGELRDALKDRLEKAPGSLEPRALRVVASDDGAWAAAEYTVGRSIDRVGLRLEGAKPMVEARAGTSEPSVFGAVQVTEDRTLIVHGPDGPTIGGYRKLGCVVRADLDHLGQLAPGDGVRFACVSFADAAEAFRAGRSEKDERLRQTTGARGSR